MDSKLMPFHGDREARFMEFTSVLLVSMENIHMKWKRNQKKQKKYWK
jgi:hypothetical protein